MKAKAIGMRLYRLWLWLTNRQNRLWVTPMLTGLAAVALAFGANAIGMLVGDRVPEIRTQTIDDLLAVIAASMLALAIFSLATLVSALSSSSQTATPRSTELLMGDSAARSSIGSFIGAFIFAVVARTALGTGYYTSAGRLVLFVSTMAVVAFVVLRLMLWIRSGSRLGRLSDTLERISGVTRKALLEQARQPCMGAAASPGMPAQSREVKAAGCGYLTDVNMAGLQSLAAEQDLRVHIRVRPGAFIDPATVLACVEGDPRDECIGPVRECFVLAADRTYDHDARFGMIVLGEVALRALSPSVNDPGTAIQVMSTMTSLLVAYAREARECDPDQAPQFDRLTAPACDPRELVRDAFMPIGRDGAGLIEVGVRMQKLLAVIARNAPGVLAAEARSQALHARDRGLQSLTYAADRKRLEQLHGDLFG